MTTLDNVDHLPSRNTGRRSISDLPAAGIVLPLVSAAIGFLLWEVLVRVNGTPAYLLPAPSVIIESMWRNAPLLWKEFLYTATAAGVGYLLSLVFGLLIGLAISSWKLLRLMLYPWLVISHAVPKVVIAPLFIVWLGFGMQSSILFVFIFTLFPVVVNTVTGLQSPDPELIQMMRSMRATKMQIIKYVQLPSALPFILAGVKVSATLAPVGAVIGEFVASNYGLGHLLIKAVGNLETALAFAAVFVISVFGIAVWYLAEYAERLMLPWHASQRSQGGH